jgi:DNA polymerase III subunit beta
VKLSVPSATLRELAEFAHRTAPAKPVVPLLSCVVLDATTDGQLVAKVTDYETWGRAERKANVITAGSTAVSARLVKAIAEVLPAGDVEIILDGSRLLFRSGRSKASAPALAPDDFPTWPKVGDGPRWVLDGRVLAGALAAADEVCTNAGRNEVRELERVQLTFTPDGLGVEATDRYRGYAMTVPWAEPPAGGAAPVFLQGRTVRQVVAMAKTEPRVVLEIPTSAPMAAGVARFGGVGVQVMTTLGDTEKWPGVSRVMPSADGRRSWTVETDWLIGQLDDAGKFLDKGAVRVTVDPAEGIALSAAEQDAAAFDVAGGPVRLSDDWGDEPHTQGFNPHFLAHAAKATGASAVTVWVGTPNQSVLLTVPEGTAASHTTAAVLMPVRLK